MRSFEERAKKGIEGHPVRNSSRCDFRSKGYEVMINQVSFPMHGASTMSPVKRALEGEPI